MKKGCQFLPSLLALLFCIASGQAQIVRSGNLTAHIDSLILAMPTSSGAGHYQAPSAVQQSTWKTMVEAIIAGDPGTAVPLADGLGYQILDYTDTTDVPFRAHLVLEKQGTSANHWGTYLFSRLPRRPRLIIQSPHPRYDSNTGAQGFFVYRSAGARAFFMSGTHRCNSAVFSTCSGTTSACSSGDEPYRISDQAHVVDGMFQVSTSAFLGTVDSCVFIQPHGFSKLSTDPDIIMSNGTQKSPPAGRDYLSTLRDNLLSVDPTLTFKIAHLDITWTRLIATTNTQGRLINGSSQPCTTPASAASGHFLHLEQKLSGLRDTKVNWNKLAQAVILTFPEAPTAVRQGTPAEFALLHNFPNPFNGTTTIVYTLPGQGPGSGETLPPEVTLTVYDVLGRIITTFSNIPGSPGTHTVTFDAAHLSSGVYYAVLRTALFAKATSLLLQR